MDKPRMVKVTNGSKEPIYMPWTLGLLSGDEYAEWQSYKKNQEARLKDERNEFELAKVRSIPESTRLSQWATAKGMGSDKIMDQFRSGVKKDLPTNYIPELRFKLETGVTYLTEPQAEQFKQFEKRPIEQKLKPGKTDPDIHYEGFLEFEDVDPNVPESVPAKLKCYKCEFRAKSKIGLQSHERTHKTE